MLWTLRGLVLLVGLGALFGGSLVFFLVFSLPSWRRVSACIGALALAGVVGLLVQWAGAAGGGA